MGTFIDLELFFEKYGKKIKNHNLDDLSKKLQIAWFWGFDLAFMLPVTGLFHLTLIGSFLVEFGIGICRLQGNIPNIHHGLFFYMYL